MKNIFLLLLLLLLSFHETFGQTQLIIYRDSLRQKLASEKEDTSKLDLLFEIGNSFVFMDEDSAAIYGREGLGLAQKIKDKEREAAFLWLLCFSLSLNGNFASALDFGMKELALAQSLNDTALLVESNFVLFTCYFSQEDYKTAMKYGLKAELLSKFPKIDAVLRARIYGMLGGAYQRMDQLDSALYYCNKSIQLDTRLNKEWSGIYLHFGDIYLKKGLTDRAMEYYRRGIPIAEETFLYIDLVSIYKQVSKVFELNNRMDSAVYYAQKAIGQKGVLSFPEGQLAAATQLAHLYDLTGARDSTIKYLKLSNEFREKLFSREKTREVQSLAFNQQLHQQDLVTQEEKARNRINTYALLAIISVILIIAFIQWRNNKQKQKANQILQNTLGNLKSAQAQLIQSEKMASLGELTAGIAHEIQNPLNFVNNFSDLNKELLAELEQAIGNRQKAKGNSRDERNDSAPDDPEVFELMHDIKMNLEKINHHGRRADAIVKGMLQHSRSGINEKEPTNINRLADEYFRLAYHGLRGKDPQDAAHNSFNAILKTDYDYTIGNISLIPQDIGRVLLNIYNNAFYAVNERRKSSDEFYEPTVTVSTGLVTSSDNPLLPAGVAQSAIRNSLILSVKDNGTGIPESIREKIFQPFFTTKPTGQGTGLGLSLAYDIITKGHGGELKVNSVAGEGTEFILVLPVQS